MIWQYCSHSTLSNNLLQLNRLIQWNSTVTRPRENKLLWKARRCPDPGASLPPDLDVDLKSTPDSHPYNVRSCINLT